MGLTGGAKKKTLLTVCITWKIESGIEVVDEATGADTLAVIDVVWTGNKRPEEENNVIIP